MGRTDDFIPQTGIWVWSEPFIVKDADGNETAVVLMDTQGMHGVNKSANQSSGIHAMGLLLASHQVYNVSGHVDESTLQHLELSSAMGEVASESFTDHTFQSLQVGRVGHLHVLTSETSFWSGIGSRLDKAKKAKKMGTATLLMAPTEARNTWTNLCRKQMQTVG